MDRAQSRRTRRLHQGRSAAGWAAYLLLCGGIVYAGSVLGITDFAFAPRAVQTRPTQPAAEVPVARIQFIPDRNNLCRALLFHNDSGRYQDAGIGKCTLSADMMVWTIHGRSEAFAEAFKSAWKGDTVTAAP
jgi:hypothetical protein